jgi:glycosyltransferase involved in cell wall biosynthesis
VSRRYPPDFRSGSETVISNLYAEAKKRHDVFLVAGFHRDRSLIPDEALGVDLRKGGYPTRQYRVHQAAVHALQRFRPDVVLSNSIEAPTRGNRTVCIIHDLNFGAVQRGWKDWARERLYLRQCRRLAATITPSDATRKALLNLGFPPNRVHAIHNGVNLMDFRPGPGPNEAFPLQLVYPSRFVPGKGQHLILDAVARLPPQDKAKVQLTLVGAAQDPVYVDQLEVAARGQPVAIHTDVADITPWMQQAHLVVFPTLLEEGFGYTAVEAMSCAVPVAWSDQPAIREATGGIGIPIPQGDVLSWRDLIQRLLDDRSELDDLGSRGRAYVQRHYDWGEVWRNYERLLDEVAQGAK